MFLFMGCAVKMADVTGDVIRSLSY